MMVESLDSAAPTGSKPATASGEPASREVRTDAADPSTERHLGSVLDHGRHLMENAVAVGAANIWLAVEEVDDEIRVSVGDDGPGVSPADADRIFDPFFSRRSDGAGSGLGLYLSRRMAEEHAGTLRLEHRQGGGALFVISLPAVGAVSPAAAPV